MLGVGSSQISAMVVAGDLPKPQEANAHNLAQGIRAYVAYREKLVRTNRDVSANRAALLREQARMAELERQVQEGKLVDLKELNALVVRMFLNFRSRILSLPTKLGARLANRKSADEVRTILTEAIDDALREFSRIANGVAPFAAKV